MDIQSRLLAPEIPLDRMTLCIENRLAGQVRDLEVEWVSDQRLIIRGRTATYHARQLVEQALIDFLGDAVNLVDEIDVR